MLASSSSLSAEAKSSETDTECSAMKKSLTLPGSLCQWSKKMSSSWTSSFGRVKKKSAERLSAKSTAELMKNFEFEEDQFIKELELLQRNANLGAIHDGVHDANFAAGTGRQQHRHKQQQQAGAFGQCRPSRSTSEASSVASSICVSAQSDLLGSFCHLMNYVVHLRRENRHLRKQVLCLQEMRKIEQLQNELLRAACTCRNADAADVAATNGTTSGAAELSASSAAAITNNRNDSKRAPTVKLGDDVIPATANNNNNNGPSRKPTAVVGTDSELCRNGTARAALNRQESASLGRLKSVRRVLNENITGRAENSLLAALCDKDPENTPSQAESRTPEDPLSSAPSLELSSVSPSLQQPTGLPPRPVSARSMSDVRRQAAAIVDANSRLLAARSVALLSPNRGALSSTAVVRHSAEEALAEPTGADLSHLLMQTSAEFSSSSLLSSNARNTNRSDDRNLSDSEDQTSVFAEVQLPTLKDSAGILPNSIQNKYSRPSRDSRYQPFPAVPVTKPITSTPEFTTRNSTAAAILERLGIRPLRSRRPSQQDQQERRPKSGHYGNLSANPTDWSRCAPGNVASPTATSTNTATSVDDIDRWKLVRKAFIKKRKRKISESDSVASSDTSCKQPYAKVELPDISYTRKNSYPPAVPVVTTVDVEALQRSVKESKEYTQKMKEWEDKKKFSNLNPNSISPKGNQTKRSWLRRSNKQQRVDNGDPGGLLTPGQQHLDAERYFEMDDNGRQMTVIQYDQNEEYKSNLPPNSRRWLSPPNIHTAIGRFGSEINLRESSDVKTKLAVSERPRRKEIDKRRSVTFCDHSGADTLSIATSQMTVSNDSVFAALEADFNNSANNGSDLVQHLLTLQEKNSLLIRTLREKTEEYEKITDQLSSLENEVKMLRDRYRYDTALENIYSSLMDPSNYVPCSMVEELENQIQTLDSNIRSIKSEAYHTQQVTMESYLKEQAASRRYLDQIETLQKTNLQLIQRQLSDLNPHDPDLRRQFQVIQNYDSLFRFAINLLRKVKHYRCKLLEKHSSVTKLDFELVQTQSSLLLAHAQIERQKMELKSFQTNQRQIRRAQSYSGQDILLRLINSQMSFYLPFKLHGSRLSKIDHHYLSDISLYGDGDDVLENEFARLFESAQRASDNYEELELPIRDFPGSCYNNGPNRRSIASGERTRNLARTNNDRPKSCLENHNHVISLLPNTPTKLHSGANLHKGSPAKLVQARPGSCIVPTVSSNYNSFERPKQNHADFRKISEEIPKCSNNNVSTPSPQRPIYATKAPTPLKLGNVGQVRSIAAVFDLPPPNDNPSSAPNTPLSKGAPHLCHSRDNSATYRRLYDSPPSQVKFQQQQQQQVVNYVNSNPVVMRNSPNAKIQNSNAERMTVSSTFKPQSKIPVRQVSVVETPSLLGYSQPLLSAKRTSPPGSERPYETLTFRRNVRQPPYNQGDQGHPSQQFLTPGDFMDKSSTPEFETTSLSTSAGSNWSIARRNEVRRRQFFYGESPLNAADSQINAAVSSINSSGPSPPPPTISPSPPKSPVPSSPTPLLGRPSLKSSKFLASSQKQQTTTKDTKQSQNVNNAQETAKKRTSWFQKFRHKK